MSDRTGNGSTEALLARLQSRVAECCRASSGGEFTQLIIGSRAGQRYILSIDGSGRLTAKNMTTSTVTIVAVP